MPAYQEKEVYLVTVYGLKDDIDSDNDSAERIVRIYFLRWRIEEYFKSKKQKYKWENSIVRTLKAINNLNMFLTIVMLKLSMYIEKMDKNILSTIIIERAMALKEKCIIWFGRVSQGTYEILKFARKGIKEWQKIEKRSKNTDKYLQLKLDLI